MCSRKVPADIILKSYDWAIEQREKGRCVVSEFHSQIEKTENEYIDNQKALKLKKILAQEFKDQLTLGYPTEADEKGLRKLSREIKEQKVFVKLYLKTGLHAKLYLLFRDDKINPSIGYLGSSNLTLAGLSIPTFALFSS